MQKSITAFNQAHSGKCKKPELGRELHYEKYLIEKLVLNMRNHLLQRNINKGDIEFVIKRLRDTVTEKNILDVYGRPIALILQYMASGEISKLKQFTASYKIGYNPDGPKQK